MATMNVELTEAQERVLGTMSVHARCVGAAKTEPEHGFVHTATARSLAELGLCHEELSAMGRHVFVLSAEGWAFVFDRLAS